MKTKSIFVIFFSSPFITGKMIRKYTKNLYNHVAVSLDKNLTKVYSFSRYNLDNPLYAGFVQESLLRYNYKGKEALIKICEIPISDKEYNNILKYISKIKDNLKEYIYNFYSASAYMFSKKIEINKAYICVEFAIKILNKYVSKIKLEKGKFYSIKDLEGILNEYVTFEGKISDLLIKYNWDDDEFLIKRNIIIRSGYVLTNHSKLTYRLIRKNFKRGKNNGKN